MNLIIFIGLIVFPNTLLKFPKIVNSTVLFFIIFLFFVPSYIALVSYMITSKKNSNIKTVFVIMNVLTFVFPLVGTAYLNLSNAIISETTDPENYRIFDGYIKNTNSKSILPKVIPSEAKEVSYFYRFRNSLDVDYDIYLEIKLPKDSYEKEKKRLMIYDNIEIVKSPYYENSIDYRSSYTENIKSLYSIAFVSFSDKDSSIKYIISYALDPSTNTIPYFLENI